MKVTVYITVVFLLLAACNHKFLVDKRKIVNSTNGYLSFFKGEVVFYPWHDTIDNEFLSNPHKTGFKVKERDIDWLDSIANRYPIIVSKETPSSQLADTISIIPVNMQYYLGDAWTKKSENISLYYYWNGVSYVFSYRLYDYRNILRITPVRKSDIERASNFYQPVVN